MCPGAQARILSRIVAGPRCALHSSHRIYGPSLPAGPDPLRMGGRDWLVWGGITVPCLDAGTLATTRHSMGRSSTQQRCVHLLGTAMFHLD